MKTWEIKRLIEDRYRDALSKGVPEIEKRLASELRVLRDAQQHVDGLRKAIVRKLPKEHSLSSDGWKVELNYSVRIPVQEVRVLRALEEAMALNDRPRAKELIDGLVKRWNLGKVAGVAA